jgi:hypothetical protein
MEIINKTFKIQKRDEMGVAKKVYTVFVYAVNDAVRCVKVVNGKKTAKCENFSINDFNSGIRLGSVVEA